MTGRAAAVALLTAALAAPATLPAGEGVKSGPKEGEPTPGSFHPYNVNGERGKGRHHCLVCEYGLHPVALVFVREPADGKENPAVTSLLHKLDELLGKHKSKEQFLRSFVVYLTPEARGSVTEPALKQGDRDKQDQLIKSLVDDAVASKALLERLEGRAAKLKNVVITCYPSEGPKGWNISPKAEVTVVLYVEHRTVATMAFAPSTFDEAAVGRVMAGAEGLVGKGPMKK
jgi:hypothetical protein